MTTQYPEVETLLGVRMAEDQYIQLCPTNDWTGIKNRGNKNVVLAQDNSSPKTSEAYTAGEREITCWNCSESGHGVGDCTKPKNEALLKANKNKFKESKHKGGRRPPGSSTPNGPPSKFRPPSPAKNNKCQIDRKPMFWNGRTRRWVPDRDAVGAVAMTTPPTTSTPSRPGSTVCFSTPAASVAQGNTNSTSQVAERRAAVANATWSITEVLQSVLRQFE